MLVEAYEILECVVLLKAALNLIHPSNENQFNQQISTLNSTQSLAIKTLTFIPMSSSTSNPNSTQDDSKITQLLSPTGTLSNFLLPFHISIIRNLIPLNDEPLDEGDALIILARGLGLRSIIAAVLKIYDGPRNLVVVVNATPDEEASLGEELTILGAGKPGLRVVGYEMGAKQRLVIQVREEEKDAASRICSASQKLSYSQSFRGLG